jgi:hypothetical protein
MSSNVFQVQLIAHASQSWNSAPATFVKEVVEAILAHPEAAAVEAVWRMHPEQYRLSTDLVRAVGHSFAATDDRLRRGGYKTRPVPTRVEQATQPVRRVVFGDRVRHRKKRVFP